MADRQREVVWSARAFAAIDDIAAYVAEDLPQAAEELVELFLDTAESLSHLSERGRIVPEIGDSAIREVFVYDYRMLYQVSDRSVKILALLHGARDFKMWVKSVGGL